MNLEEKIYIAGHRGMVGSSIIRLLKKQGYKNLLFRTHNQLDLTNQLQVKDFFLNECPDLVYLAAAKVGGIYANNVFPVDFLHENLMIQANIINSAFNSGVKKILFLGSSCIYPKLANQPISEDSLLSGILESTNEPYAIAKIAGIKLCESYNRQYGETHGVDYRSIMPCNLYGPGDNYHSENSHVIPALIRRFHDAKIKKNPTVQIWGTGTPKREFLHVDDLANACLHIMNMDKSIYKSSTKLMQGHINAGSGKDISIKELASTIANIVEYKGSIEFDHSKSDGSPRKLLDSSLINSLGWYSSIELKEGLKSTYDNYCASFR
jgi:GDP-L-fucose synthase